VLGVISGLLTNRRNRMKAPQQVQLRRAPQPSLHEQIAEIIRDMIVEGELGEGSFIDEAAMATHLKVSRTPVREALKVLAYEGLVEIFPNQGSYVSRITGEDASHLIELLADLEGFGGAMACERGSDEEILAIKSAHERMIAAYVAEDKPNYFRLNQIIHDGIVEASANRHLIDAHRRCSRRLRRIRYLSNLKKEAWKKSVADHEAILEALLKRSDKTLRKIMTEHALGIWTDVEQLFLESNGDFVDAKAKLGKLKQ
jgi:DNA-binding GntR family transcriptional regulator